MATRRSCLDDSSSSVYSGLREMAVDADRVVSLHCNATDVQVAVTPSQINGEQCSLQQKSAPVWLSTVVAACLIASNEENVVKASRAASV